MIDTTIEIRSNSVDTLIDAVKTLALVLEQNQGNKGMISHEAYDINYFIKEL